MAEQNLHFPNSAQEAKDLYYNLITFIDNI